MLVIIALAMLLLAPQSRAGVTTAVSSFINVGQGDSILLRDGNGFDVLIDGGDTDAGPIVVTYLRAQSVDDIDVMVNSHPDRDYVGGLINVLEMGDTPVRAVINNGFPGTSGVWNTFTTALANEGLEPTSAQYPDTFIWGSLIGITIGFYVLFTMIMETGWMLRFLFYAAAIILSAGIAGTVVSAAAGDVQVEGIMS